MKLKDLIKKLQGKPDQNTDVEFLVIRKNEDTILCMDMTDITADLMKALANRSNKKAAAKKTG